LETAFYYTIAVVLILASATCWVSLLFTLPGNWVMALLATLFALSYPDAEGMSWWTVGALILLAAVGELVEFVAGAAGAAKQGASRRSMVLAILGTMIGSLAGAIVGVPVPIVGSIIAALGGGALGAFAGAYLGELWKGKTSRESMNVGTGAMVGRVLGTFGKLIVGAIMFVLVSVAVFVPWF